MAWKYSKVKYLFPVYCLLSHSGKNHVNLGKQNWWTRVNNYRARICNLSFQQTYKQQINTVSWFVFLLWLRFPSSHSPSANKTFQISSVAVANVFGYSAWAVLIAEFKSVANHFHPLKISYPPTEQKLGEIPYIELYENTDMYMYAHLQKFRQTLPMGKKPNLLRVEYENSA